MSCPCSAASMNFDTCKFAANGDFTCPVGGTPKPATPTAPKPNDK